MEVVLNVSHTLSVCEAHLDGDLETLHADDQRMVYIVTHHLPCLLSFQAVEALVSRAQPIPILLPDLTRLENLANSAKAWRERTSRTFKRNSLTLLEVRNYVYVHGGSGTVCWSVVVVVLFGRLRATCFGFFWIFATWRDEELDFFLRDSGTDWMWLLLHWPSWTLM